MKWLKVMYLLLAAAVGPLVSARQAQPQSAKQEIAMLSQLRQQHDAALKAFTRSPKNATLKQRYVFATVKLGMKTMYAQSLTSHQRYPEALKLFKEALKVDPKNADAREQKDMIEAVYRQMGKKPGG